MNLFYFISLNKINMTTQLYEINVSLSENQKKKLSKAYHERETIKLRLKYDALIGNDTLLVPSNVVKRLEKNRTDRKGMEIKLAKTNIRKQVGGSLLTSILSLARTFGPTLAKTVGLSALAGAASEGASQIVKKISGKGSQIGGFLIPNSKIDQLIENKHLLSNKQKKDILNALQTGSGVHIKPTQKQSGGFLGTLLASIGVPLALEAFKKMVGGSGVPRIGKPPFAGGAAPRMGRYQPIPPNPPPFLGTWENTGGGKKKKKSGKGLLLGKNSPFNGIPLLGTIL